MTMTPEQLKPFCGTEELISYLKTPYTRGDYTYATNAHIMVRVPRMDGFDIDCDAADQRLVNTANSSEKLFSEYFSATDLRPMVYGNLPSLVEKTCKECGTVHLVPEKSESSISVSIGEAFFCLKYVRLMQTLLSVCVQRKPDPEKPMSFTFDGGEGLLMPLRSKENSNHLEITI